MNKIEKMAQLVSDLGVLNVKFHNLHWNVVGLNFESVHLLTEASYNDFFKKYDEVAERMKILGAMPPASIKKYLELTKIQELEDKEYKISEVLNYALDSYQYLKTEFYLLRDLAEKDHDVITVALCENYMGEFEKQIWFISSMKK